MTEQVFNEKAFDEFLQLTMKYTGLPKYITFTQHVKFSNGVEFKPGHYRLGINGYEEYDPEEQQ